MQELIHLKTHSCWSVSFFINPFVNKARELEAALFGNQSALDLIGKKMLGSNMKNIDLDYPILDHTVNNVIPI